MNAIECIESLKNNRIPVLTKDHFLINFNSDELDLLVSNLLLSTDVESIELENTEINNNMLKILSDVLPYDNSIRSLTFRNIDNITKHIPVFQEIIQFNTGIERLEISNNKKGDEVIGYLGLYRNTKIKELILTNTFKNAGSETVAQVISSNKKIVNLDISHQNLIGNNLKNILKKDLTHSI